MEIDENCRTDWRPEYDPNRHVPLTMKMEKKCKTEWRPEYDRDYHAVRDGMFVCGADGDKIGEVSKIYAGPGEDKAHLLVRKGPGVEQDVYIPLDAINAIDRDNLFLECPSGDCVKKKDWTTAPSETEEINEVYLNLAEDSSDIYPNIVCHEQSHEVMGEQSREVMSEQSHEVMDEQSREVMGEQAHQVMDEQRGRVDPD
jgi:hypothetical protein